MIDTPSIVVIGGGVVGCSVLYSLTRRGWNDALLLERRNLTSGSTWHAAGNVTFFGHYSSITGLYVNSVQSYLAAEQETGHNVGFHPAGSLRLATSKQEFDYYRSLETTYEKMGIEYQVISPESIKQFHPFLVTDGLFGAAHTPQDGHVDPTGATYALAKAAKSRGAKVKLNCPVQFLEHRNDNEWRIHTSEGYYQTEHVVIATSFWARELVQNLGLNLPLYAMEHHELITDQVAELDEVGFEVPTVRDPYVPANWRQERSGFLIGIYERGPKPWSIDGIPPDFKEELLVPDTERLEPHFDKLMQRMPVLADVGIKTVNNGPICYTPDGLPLLGPVADMPGLWLACGYCVGIGTGGGSGEFLASWIVDGKSPYDLPQVYPARFSNDLSKQACLKQIIQTYENGYSLQ